LSSEGLLMNSRFISLIVILIILMTLYLACSDENDMLDLDNVLSGTVTNNSGVSGTIYVEIQYNLRDVADGSGRWSILVHDDYYVDSLYSYVDVNEDDNYDPGEPFGFYGGNSTAKGFLVRNMDVSNLNFSIP